MNIHQWLSNNAAARFGVLFVFAALILGLYYISSLKVCENHEVIVGDVRTYCYDYTSRIWWSAMSLKLVARFGIPVLVGGAIGWLTYNWKYWAISTGVLILLSVGLGLVPVSG